MADLKFGLIGTGFMGKAHAIALKAAPTVFSLPAFPVCELLAEVDDEQAVRKARELGFARSTGDWKALVEDPDVDVVDICAPNFLHKEMALAAIAAGKHVYAEKPLALSAVDAQAMVEAAEAAGVKTLVGFNYIRNSATQLAREIVQSGEIGELVHFRGRHNEDYLADPTKPMTGTPGAPPPGLAPWGIWAHISSTWRNISPVNASVRYVASCRR
ncbi:inositol 2-dehydrogenase [Halomonas elongata]|uniref:Inositol 2-dehydrogenase n=1 Tax=Halomonas elongata TaxID=2746 RepID=A0A1B8P037_HALEL|nr:Gfo/Idh/MocA family oxidoreductase [Halomonas elongata]OBX35590.1 inositol 2-dehydrogenase [Halomonas elongata]